jgi:drug/metabolite transporter (DMT)-like permease
MSIWWFAFGYFACYVPYSALVKAMSDGLIDGVPRQAGLALLPWSNVAAFLTSILFISAMGWWKHAGRRRILGRDLPFPSRYTALSGLGSSAVIMTTTLAYTFQGTSIVFMMLLLRGGLLVLAPLVDLLSGRHVRALSWLALGLSLGSLLVAFFGSGGDTKVTLTAIIDVAIYLAAYFIRLRFMSRLAKSSDPDHAKRYFVEEQLVATPALVLLLIVMALVAPANIAVPLQSGWTGEAGATGILLTVLVGILSQGTGIFGGLILLDRRENSFCVPVNRASSMLAGLIATLLLAALFGKKMPPTSEFVGAALVVGAILVLSLPGVLAARSRPGAQDLGRR